MLLLRRHFVVVELSLSVIDDSASPEDEISVVASVPSDDDQAVERIAAAVAVAVVAWD